MKRRRFCALIPLSLVLVVMQLAFTAHAQNVAVSSARTLEQLTAQANAIVLGRVISSRIEPHPKYPHIQTAVITLRVHEAFKGKAAETYSFRQYVWDLRDRATAAGYSRGQEVLLFMNAENQHGLSSPAGMEQGRFAIVQDSSGNAMAVNGRNNVGLLRGLRKGPLIQSKALTVRSRTTVTTHEQGPIALDSLKELVKAIVGVQQK